MKKRRELSKEDVKSLIKEEEVRFVRLQFTDIFGKPKNVTITSEQIDEALNNEVMFDGSSIDGFARIEESDMYLYPDPSSYAVLPWKTNGRSKTARLICDVYRPNGKPFEGCPRNILKRQLQKLKSMGYDYYVGPEVEFFLFETDDKGNPTFEIHDDAGYFDQGPNDLGEAARNDICLSLEDLGFEIEASHHEAAPGQHEIDFRYGDALKVADQVSTFKSVVKNVASEHGLYATFMPKPMKGSHGNCMHINQSLYKEGSNAFRDEEDELGLSEVAYYFIAGQIKRAREFAAITNATVNSYKRLMPGYEAPTDIAWATANRSPLIRIPAKRGEATRVELRNPDPTANHYLALAVTLAAGMEGIEDKRRPPKVCNQNVYDLDEQSKCDEGIETFPSSLGEAIMEMDKSEFIEGVLGDHTYNRYLEAKKIEWDEYSNEIHDWELRRYLKSQ